MSKKILSLMLLFILLLTGCNQPVNNEKQLNIDFDVDKIEIYKESDKNLESGYHNIIIDDQNEINNLINNILNTFIYEEISSSTSMLNKTFSYIIKLTDKDIIYVISNNEFVLYENTFYKHCNIKNGSFEFLNEYKFGDAYEEITLDYSVEDLEKIDLVYNDMTINITSNHYVKTMLLNMKYYKLNNEVENKNLIYQLNFENNKTLFIYQTDEQKYIINLKTESQTSIDCTVLNNEFDMLGEIVETDILSFNFDSWNKITVYNSVEENVEIKDVDTFIKNFDDFKFLKIKNTSNHTIGDMVYKIKIDDISIGIYNKKIIIINDTMYAVLEGNFDFIKGLDFSSSSGWLPWV